MTVRAHEGNSSLYPSDEDQDATMGCGRTSALMLLRKIFQFSSEDENTKTKRT